jgi:hypothetical protein
MLGCYFLFNIEPIVPLPKLAQPDIFCDEWFIYRSFLSPRKFRKKQSHGNPASPGLPSDDHTDNSKVSAYAEQALNIPNAIGLTSVIPHPLLSS